MSGREGGRGRGRGAGRPGRLTSGMRPVSESMRIDIQQILEDFRASDQQEYTFPPNLSNHDRATVHDTAKRLGMQTKSFGKGATRAVSVFKTGSEFVQKKSKKRQQLVFELPIGDASESVLNKYFTRHPPTENEIARISTGGKDLALDDSYGAPGIAPSGSSVKPSSSGQKHQNDNEDDTTKGGASRHKMRRKQGTYASEFTAEEVAKRHLLWQERTSKPQMADLIALRQALPMAAYKDEILTAITANQVIMVAGETGCGKTTQVPQYILEESWGKGAACRVICTQPRRISAISVADRIASERGEPIGENVGYTIRLESRGGPDCSLMFCTNGVLLRMLTVDDGSLDTITHLVIDEIHERDRFADFLLIIIRDILPTRPNLKVILMSATLHIELFSSYFGGIPVVQVPGFTHPVEDFYLEDVLRLTGYQEVAVKQIERDLGRSAASLVNINASGSSGNNTNNNNTGVAVGTTVSTDERRLIEAAIEASFRTGSDEDFDALMEATGAASAEDSEGGAPGINVQHTATGISALMAAAAQGRSDVVAVLLSNGADANLRAKNGSTARDLAQAFNRVDVLEMLDEYLQQVEAADELAASALALSHYQENTDADEVDLELIHSLLECVCNEGKWAKGAAAAQGSTPSGNQQQEEAQGAVLLFLPGWDEIVRMKERLENSPSFGGGNTSTTSGKYSILPLHSLVAPADQRKVFIRPPLGTRKIVLSTNIAETAVTIDDIVCVIDSGRLKEKSYDPYTGVSTLHSAWISKASERQRRGRAGRCQPGVCFRLYSRQRADAFAEFQQPEIKRTALDEMALQVKLFQRENKGDNGTDDGECNTSNVINSIAQFLAKAVEPPLPQAVENAVQLLCDIGALREEDEGLTTLGRHLAALPLPPALGKMLLYGVMYKCLDPVLTVACFMAYRDPWVLPAAAGARRDAAMVRAGMATEVGGSSDHLAAARAFVGWKKAQARGTDRGFCAHNFLSPSTMNMIDGMRGQLLSELTSRGFVSSLEESSVCGTKADLVRAVLACGFYPSVARLLPQKRRDQKAKASMVTRKDENVKVHMTSVCSSLRIEKEDDEEMSGQSAALVFYDELVRGDNFLYAKTCTAIHPHPILLVAAHVEVSPDDEDEEESEKANEDTVMIPASHDTTDNVAKVGFEAMNLADTSNNSPLNHNNPANNKQPSSSMYSIITVDKWLRFRVPTPLVIQILSLRERLAQAFAATVQRPTTPLSSPLQKALDVSASVYLNESESGDGNETFIGTSFKPDTGGNWRGSGGGFGGGRGSSHHAHVFRYEHEQQRSERGSGNWRSNNDDDNTRPPPYAPSQQQRGRGRGDYQGRSGGGRYSSSNTRRNFDNDGGGAQKRPRPAGQQQQQQQQYNPYRGPVPPPEPPGGGGRGSSSSGNRRGRYGGGGSASGRGGRGGGRMPNKY